VTPFIVTVEKHGDGGGSVTSTPSGIACGAICTAQIADDQTITLRSTPDGDSRFAGWGDAGTSCAGDTCALTVRDAIRVSVTFNRIPDYDLIVTKVGDGTGTVTSDAGLIDCGSVCQDRFREGTIVALTATAGTSSFFNGWDGACQAFGNNAQCTVTLNQVKAVTANFTKIPDYSIAVTLDGMGLVTSDPIGISCGGDCVKAYQQNTVVTLTVVPAPGWRWVKWIGDANCGTATTCSLTVNGMKSITAQLMQIPTYRLTVATAGDGGGGRVTSDATGIGTGIDCGSVCYDSYQEGTVVKLTVTTNSGYTWEGWGGDLDVPCGTNLTCTVTMNATKNVTATFRKTPLYTMTVSLQGDTTGTVTSDVAGISCDPVCQATYKELTLPR
jgi:hypothetical protein